MYNTGLKRFEPTDVNNDTSDSGIKVRRKTNRVWKASRYNIYDEEKFSYIANTLTGSCILVTKEEIFRVKREILSEFSEDELIILEENGIIVDSELDEVQLLRNAYNFCKYTSKKATITIVPSLACNFDCVYCYENKTNDCMSEGIQEQVLTFIQSLLEDHHISELNVCWYGGEPLLHVDIIKKLSIKLVAFCNKKRLDYHASIITNGYLVDYEIVDVFKHCFIKTAQITIDGTKKAHDSRRKLINGEETYEKVKNAIFLLAENDISVAVRVNLDKSNVHEYKNVYDVFAGKAKIKCYPAVEHVSEELFGTVVTAKYLGRDPFTEEECEKCPYIPVCYGGCVYEYQKHNTHACKAVKFMYKEYCQKETRRWENEGDCQKEE